MKTKTTRIISRPTRFNGTTGKRLNEGPLILFPKNAGVEDRDAVDAQELRQCDGPLPVAEDGIRNREPLAKKGSPEVVAAMVEAMTIAREVLEKESSLGLLDLHL